jgi:SAM-dependent methyltransferase
MSANYYFDQIKNYYEDKFNTYGARERGVDWSSKLSQELRFEQLLKIIHDKLAAFTIADVGCGYGALLEYLEKNNYENYHYFGFELVEAMIEFAKKKYSHIGKCEFILSNKLDVKYDYLVASGIFNLKFNNDSDSWLKFILDTIDEFNEKSTKGFAFNCLTKYSDSEKMRPCLFFADPCFLFDYCKMKFSKDVALIHDYGLYEFTILVRKDIQ